MWPLMKLGFWKYCLHLWKRVRKFCLLGQRLIKISFLCLKLLIVKKEMSSMKNIYQFIPHKIAESEFMHPTQCRYTKPRLVLDSYLWKLVTQSCPTLCESMNYAVHGILQAKILEWVALLFSRRFSQTRDQTQVSHTAGEFFTSSATREAPVDTNKCKNICNPLLWSEVHGFPKGKKKHLFQGQKINYTKVSISLKKTQQKEVTIFKELQ